MNCFLLRTHYGEIHELERNQSFSQTNSLDDSIQFRECQEHFGETPLHLAARSGCVRTADVLLKLLGLLSYAQATDRNSPR